MDRIEKTRLQLDAVAILRALKESRTYAELADLTGLPASDLNRYVNGHVLPGQERASNLVGDIASTHLAEEIEERIEIDADGYIDTTRVVFDQSFLELLAPLILDSLGDEYPDVVLTAATDGITFAAAIAGAIDARCVYAKKRKETGVDEFIESRQRLDSGIELTYYLPATAIDAGDTILIVDDLIRSGETQSLLFDMASQADGIVQGVYTLIAVGDQGLTRVQELTNVPVSAVTVINT